MLISFLGFLYAIPFIFLLILFLKHVVMGYTPIPYC